MLEDYVVTIRLPVNETPGATAAVLGAGFGLNVEASSEAIWYSDGQDIWLPESQPTVYAMFRGQLRFVPRGSLNLDAPSDTSTPPSPEEPPSPLLPAIGDCLVLELWPQDFLKLRELLPDPLLVPKRIVYQNIDQNSAVLAAAALIGNHIAYYKKLFLNEGEREDRISNETIVERAETWLRNKWILGSSVGVYVDPTESAVAIGEAALAPRTAPAELPAYARVDHGTPDTAIGLRRLTLKVLNEDDQLMHPAFLFYLLARTEDEALAMKWPPDSAFILAQQSAVGELPAVHVEVRASESFDPDPLPTWPMFFQINRSPIPVGINGLFDPFYQPEESMWRFQSKLPPGDYHETYHGPSLLLAQQIVRPVLMPGEITQREMHPASIEEILGFDLDCFRTALAAVTEEEVVNLLRGSMQPDGTRATSQGLYRQYNIPDSVGTSGHNSWRSWEERRTGTEVGVGGGWFMPRNGGGNWLDFYRSPTDRLDREDSNPLVWRLIEGLRRDPNITRIILEQYQRACNQYSRHRTIYFPIMQCVDLSLALVATYRQFQDAMLSASSDEVNSFGDGGLDDIGRGMPGCPRTEIVCRGGDMPRIVRNLYIRPNLQIRPVLVNELNRPFINENRRRVIPAMIRQNEIFEIYTSVFNWWSDNVHHKLRRDRLYPADFDRRSRWIWERANISTPGKVNLGIANRERWRMSPSSNSPPTGDANNVRGNFFLLERLVDHRGRHTNVFRKGHVSAADAEVFERLVIRRAEDCYAHPPPTP